MAEPPSKRCCVRNMDSFSDDEYEKHSIGPNGIFPSEGDADSDDDGERCFFPSEDSLNPELNQTVVAEAVSIDIRPPGLETLFITRSLLTYSRWNGFYSDVIERNQNGIF